MLEIEQFKGIGRVGSAAVIGVDAVRIDVEAQIFGALRRLAIVGLPDGALREAKDRVRCAIENSGFTFPEGEVVVSLSPACLPKTGSGFDLAIALSVLSACAVVPDEPLRRMVVLGELTLDGSLRPVRGVLAVACLLRAFGDLELLVPTANAEEALLARGVKVRSAGTLAEVVAFLNGIRTLELREPPVEDHSESAPAVVGFGDVIGQHGAKRALEIVAAGGHNLLMVGPPGAGKSMLAERLPSILPPLTLDEQIEVSKIYSASAFDSTNPDQSRRQTLIRSRPYRAPHHTTSAAGLIGGGPVPIPGEISLAHRGVLFLDEVTELRREALEALRQPLETKHITISRAKFRLRYPADFMLVAAMNPCPCGRYGLPDKSCACGARVAARYAARVSGPIMDRMDLQIWVPPVPVDQLRRGVMSDPTPGMRSRVFAARKRQSARLRSQRPNAQLQSKEIKEYCRLDEESGALLEAAVKGFHLSARGYSRILKVARTIADLEGSENLSSAHVTEALGYRLRIGEESS